MFRLCRYKSTTIHDGATTVAPQHSRWTVVLYLWSIKMNLDESGGHCPQINPERPKRRPILPWCHNPATVELRF